MEIVIIGGIAAGMSVAAKARRTNKDAKITVIERESFISFGACGLPYFVGGQFEDENNMFARTPEQIEASGINLLLEHEVCNVNYTTRTLEIKDLAANEVFEKRYDRLMIATGATPLKPKGEHLDAPNVYTMTKLVDATTLKANLDAYNHITVIGGGFIGVEMSEQLRHLGKKVSLVQATPHIMDRPFDPEFSQRMEAALTEIEVELHLNELMKTLKLDETTGLVCAVETNKSAIQTDAVILAIGFKPNTHFAHHPKLHMLANGAIVINAYGETSIPDVYAAGDCATIPHRLMGLETYLPLATTANKMGRIIGTNIAVDRKDRIEYIGTLGSSAIKIGNFEAATSGLTETVAKELKIDYKTTTIETNNHTNYWPGQSKLLIKLVYHATTKVLLGAQIFGRDGAVLRMTGLSMAIHAEMTTDELGFVDFSYSPPFASTWEAINVAANTAK